jgi:hypothetical protein
MKTHSIKIQHETFGVMVNETIIDPIQFKLFLKAINASLELKDDLSFFNGEDFLFHIPFKFLKESIIITSVVDSNLAQRMKSKVEALVTKETE